MLKVSGLVKTYGKLRAVDQVSFEVNQGDVYGFLGPNGSGKTTTIRAILGLISTDAGQVEICGHNVARESSRALANVAQL
ncbi:MAG: ATP-binding cassette domain-containing protein [Firmicutes bacterium]|nr:ATP-binding cassette domain-containing protein [Bacillota bacterium]